ncbi:hypothetical protein F5Y19DRAFT_481817 [Xylariaceae sp. FL1651]|nr:hypothetical protein F5Y19DRAFT_481817 [Xylariaceae sp. FL1651]
MRKGAENIDKVGMSAVTFVIDMGLLFIPLYGEFLCFDNSAEEVVECSWDSDRWLKAATAPAMGMKPATLMIYFVLKLTIQVRRRLCGFVGLLSSLAFESRAGGREW